VRRALRYGDIESLRCNAYATGVVFSPGSNLPTIGARCCLVGNKGVVGMSSSPRWIVVVIGVLLVAGLAQAGAVYALGPSAAEVVDEQALQSPLFVFAPRPLEQHAPPLTSIHWQSHVTDVDSAAMSNQLDQPWPGYVEETPVKVRPAASASPRSRASVARELGTAQVIPLTNLLPSAALLMGLLFLVTRIVPRYRRLAV
jgi:hypothetical protein